MDLELIRSIRMSDLLDSMGISHRAHKVRCPFHNDKKPSLSIKRNFWFCFSCNEKGDNIRFVEKYHGVDFINAVKLICQYQGFQFKGKIKRNYEREALLENKKILLDILGNEEDFLIFEHRFKFKYGHTAKGYTRLIWIEERLNEIYECRKKLDS